MPRRIAKLYMDGRSNRVELSLDLWQRPFLPLHEVPLSHVSPGFA